MPQNIPRVTSRVGNVRKSTNREKRARKPALETLEQRELLAVLPVGLVVAPTPLGGIAAQNLVVATFTSQDSGADWNNFQATVNWGDSTPTDPATTIVHKI